MKEIEFTKTFKYSCRIDLETGEMIDVRLIGEVEDKTPTEIKEKKEKKTSTPRKSKKKSEESSEPQLTLEENKCSFNTAAVELLGIEAGDKLAIEYEKYCNGFRPILFRSEKTGNKLTKSHTIACRGSKSEELAKFGTVFKITTHPSKPSTYLLLSDSMTEKVEEELPIDVDLPELTDLDEDSEIQEISSDFFTDL